MRRVFQKTISFFLIIAMVSLWYVPQSVSAQEDSQLTDIIITVVDNLTPKQIERFIAGKQLVGKKSQYQQSVEEKTKLIEEKIENLQNEALLQLKGHNNRIQTLNNTLRSTLDAEAAKLYTFDYVIYNTDADYVREQRRIYVEKAMRERQISYADGEEYIQNYITSQTQSLKNSLEKYKQDKKGYDLKRALSFKEKNIRIPNPIRPYNELNTKQQAKIRTIGNAIIPLIHRNDSLASQIKTWDSIPDIGSQEYTALESEAKRHLGGVPATAYRWSSVVDAIETGQNWQLEWKNQFGSYFNPGRNSWTLALSRYAASKTQLLQAQKKAEKLLKLEDEFTKNLKQLDQYILQIKRIRSYDYIIDLLEGKNMPHVFGDFISKLQSTQEKYLQRISTQQKRLEDYNREKILYEKYAPYRETLIETLKFLKNENPEWFQFGIKGRNHFYKKRKEFKNLLSQTISPIYKDILDIQTGLQKSNQKTGEEYLKTDTKTWEQYLAGNVSLASANKYLFEGRKNITAKLVNARSKLDKEISAIKASRTTWTQAYQNKLERVSLEAHEAKLHAYLDWPVFYHQHPLVDEEDRSRKSQWLGELLTLEDKRINLVNEVLRNMDIHRDSFVSYAIESAQKIHNGSTPTDIPIFVAFGKDPEIKAARKAYNVFVRNMPKKAHATQPKSTSYDEVTVYNYKKEIGNFINTMHYYNSEAGKSETEWINDKAAEDHWGKLHKAYMDETGIEISYQEFIRRSTNVNGIGLEYPDPIITPPTPDPDDDSEETGSGSVDEEEVTGSGTIIDISSEEARKIGEWWHSLSDPTLKQRLQHRFAHGKVGEELGKALGSERAGSFGAVVAERYAEEFMSKNDSVEVIFLSEEGIKYAVDMAVQQAHDVNNKLGKIIYETSIVEITAENAVRNNAFGSYQNILEEAYTLLDKKILEALTDFERTAVSLFIAKKENFSEEIVKHYEKKVLHSFVGVAPVWRETAIEKLKKLDIDFMRLIKNQVQVWEEELNPYLEAIQDPYFYERFGKNSFVAAKSGVFAPIVDGPSHLLFDWGGTAVEVHLNTYSVSLKYIGLDEYSSMFDQLGEEIDLLQIENDELIESLKNKYIYDSNLTAKENQLNYFAGELASIVLDFKKIGHVGEYLKNNSQIIFKKTWTYNNSQNMVRSSVIQSKLGSSLSRHQNGWYIDKGDSLVAIKSMNITSDTYVKNTQEILYKMNKYIGDLRDYSIDGKNHNSKVLKLAIPAVDGYEKQLGVLSSIQEATQDVKIEYIVIDSLGDKNILEIFTLADAADGTFNEMDETLQIIVETMYPDIFKNSEE